MVMKFEYDHRQWNTNHTLVENESILENTNIDYHNTEIKARYQYNNVVVLGYTNRRNLYTDNWEESMHRAKLPYYLICTNSKFNGHHEVANGYLKYIKSQPINNDTIYICVDAHDAFACSSSDSTKTNTLDDIIERWLLFKQPIVVGTEIWEANGNELHEYWKYNARPCTNHYVNTGLLAGTREALIHMFEWVMQNYRESTKNGEIWCDQRGITRYIDKYHHLMALDTEYRIFANSVFEWNRSNVTKFKWCHNRLTYTDRQYDKLLTTTPCFVHTPSRFNDALRRYTDYGKLILGCDYKSCWKEMIRPTPLWVILIVIIVLSMMIFLYYIGYSSSTMGMTYGYLFECPILALILIAIFTLIVACQTIDPTH